jgi:cell division septal protein FtsQ
VLVGVAVGLMWLPSLRADVVEVSGASSVGTQNVEEVVRAELAGTYGYVIPKNNVLVYPRDTIQKKLLERFVAFESVTVRLKNVKTVAVTITERKTTALWCGESPENPSPCYLLDASGKAYAPAAQYSGELYVKYYGETTGSTAKQYLSSDQFANLAAVVTAMSASDVKEMPVRTAVNKGEVHVWFESGFEIIYLLKDNAGDVLERLKIALASEPFSKYPIDQIAYLDLRFGDKLYFHRK